MTLRERLERLLNGCLIEQDGLFVTAAYNALVEEIGALIGVAEAARRLKRGCDCEYDHRCRNCQAVMDVMKAVERLDARGGGGGWSTSRESINALRKWRRENQVCERCSRGSPTRFCPPCNELAKAESKAYRARLVAAGKCIECREPVSGQQRCEACSAKHRERCRRWRGSK